MNKKAKLSVFVLSCLAVLCLLPALLPPVQNAAVSFVETHKNDDINDVFWKQQMFAFASLGIIFIIILNLVLFTKKGYETFQQIKNDFLRILESINKNKKYLFILIGLYSLGYFSIIRANFWNFAIDDLPRQMEGSREWVNFYRYFAEIGSIFIHTSMNVFDIAPLTQFIALILVALASFFAISIFADNTFSIKLCIASLPIALFPYFLSNYSYRYDSPYMALSLCISIVPFLFTDNLKTYIFASIICLFIMCTSYQASSGIYIFTAILVFVKLSLFEKKSAKDLFIFTVTSVLCYAFTLLLFSALFIEQAQGGSYVDESLNISKIIPNTVTYLKAIFSGLGKSSVLSFSILTVILFFILSITNSKASKIISVLVITLAILVSVPFTFGSYLALGRPEFIPRTFIGIGVFVGFISIFAMVLIKNNGILRIVTLISCFCLSYSTLAFAFAFGNAQYDQKEYIKFRGTILAQDLSECISPSNEVIELLFVNDIGYAPSVEVLKNTYPLISKAIDKGFSGDRESEFVLESLNLVSLKEKPNHNYKNADYPVFKETLYHKIQGLDNRYLITFKVPRLKTIKTRSFIQE